MRELSNQQRLNLVNTVQLHENHLDALRHAQDYRYGMRWKTSRGCQYLFRERDRRGNGHLLGPRNPETERILAEFLAGKQRCQERLKGIAAQLDEQARLNKALRLGRVPVLIAKILRHLQQQGLGEVFTVLGTQALFAYEAEAGVQLLTELLASGDMDLLYDPRQNLDLMSERLEGIGLLGLLQKVDRSFVCVRQQGFRAANAGHFMVDLIIPERPMQESNPITFAEEDLYAAEVPGLQWLLNAPKIKVVAVDEQGYPVTFRVPDPRAFALHKAWLAQQPSREPLKRPRDKAQATALLAMLRTHMPHYPLDSAALRYMPKGVATAHP